MTLQVPKRLRGNKKAAHSRSPKQEKELAKRIGGKQVKGSGCGFAKGDVRLKNKVLVEAKCTEKKSFALTRKLVRKIEDEACGNGELPVIEIEFLNKGKPHDKIYVIPAWALESLLGE